MSPEPEKPSVALLIEAMDLPRPQRRALFLRSALVGLLSGVVAVGFKLALDGVSDLHQYWLGETEPGPATVAVNVLFSAAVVAVGVALVQAAAPEAAGSGIPHLERVLLYQTPFRWLRVLWVKFVGGVLAIGGGLTLGREGPTVQMGAAVGRALSPADEPYVLTAVGAGAGLAAAFNAPLAGAAFVAEELREVARPASFLAALLGSTIADVVARQLLGQNPVFDRLTFDVPPLTLLPIALGLGAAGGLGGWAFNLGVLKALDAAAVARRRIGAVGLGALIGGSVGLVGAFRPDLLGGGHELLVEMLTTAPLLGAVLVIAAARSVLTIAGYASGAAGGLFMPLLVLGACLGASTQALPLPSGVAPAVPVVLGMAALFAGSIRAPATGVLLMIEMTNGYALILPLLVASLAAELTAGELGGRPLYAALRDRDSAAALAGVANPTSPSN